MYRPSKEGVLSRSDGAPGNPKDAEVFAWFVCDFLALRVLVDGVRWPAWPGKGVVVSRVGGIGFTG